MHMYPLAVGPAGAGCCQLHLQHFTAQVSTAVAALQLQSIGQLANHVEGVPAVTAASWEVSFPIPCHNIAAL